MTRRRRRVRSGYVGAGRHVMEKRNPIPPGLYWLDVMGRDRGVEWAMWLGQNAATVEVVRREHHPLGEVNLSPFADDDGVAGYWVLFKVKAPTPRWAVSAKLGLPTVAISPDMHKEDTEVAPSESVSEYWDRELDEAGEKLKSGAQSAFSGLAFLALVYFLATSSKRR